MQLTFKSTVSGRPLIKNPNGTLRLGRWWGFTPDAQYFTSENMGSATNFSSTLISTAVTNAKTAGSWITQNSSDGSYFDAYAMTAFSEDYPYYDPTYKWAAGYGRVALYSYTIPAALQARTVRSVVIRLYFGGCTLLEFGAVAPEYIPYPLTASPWSYASATCGLRFSSSKPASPNAVSTAHTNVLFSDLTNAAISAGANIIFDGSNYWTIFNGGYVDVGTPTAVKTVCQGAAKIWVCAWPTSVSAFTLPSGYSKAEHNQSARCGVPALYIYA